MFIYLTAAGFYFVGVICGYVGASIISMYNDNLLRTKNTLDEISATRLYSSTANSEDDSEF